MARVCICLWLHLELQYCAYHWIWNAVSCLRRTTTPVVIDAFFLAETWVRSPPKSILFIIYRNIFWIKVYKMYFMLCWKQKHWLWSTASWNTAWMCNAGVGSEYYQADTLHYFSSRHPDNSFYTGMLTRSKYPGMMLFSFEGMFVHWVQGYKLPFDRHDWVVDRCGTHVRYIIDFYGGNAEQTEAPAAMHLDVRPALDSFGACVDRVRMAWIHFLSRV